MHRFFIFEPDKIEINRVIIVSNELIHQFCNVLKFHTGEQILFLDNTGNEYLCAIENISKKEIIANVIEKRENRAEPKIKICLYQAILKNPEKFESVLQKGVEVGICEFIPLITDRVERESLNKLPRLKKILKESAEQSGRGIIPILHEPVTFKNEIAAVRNCAAQFPNKKIVHLLAHTNEKKSLKEIVGNLTQNIEQINIYIGPEGGFTDKEVLSAKDAGFKIFNLGPRILRSETAGIITSSFIIIQNQF